MRFCLPLLLILLAVGCGPAAPPVAETPPPATAIPPSPTPAMPVVLFPAVPPLQTYPEGQRHDGYDISQDYREGAFSLLWTPLEWIKAEGAPIPYVFAPKRVPEPLAQRVAEIEALAGRAEPWSLAEIIARYGEPPQVWAVGFPGPHGGDAYDYRLTYPELGLVFDTPFMKSYEPVFDAQLQFDRVSFYPGPIEPDPEAVPWRGYQPFAAYCQPDPALRGSCQPRGRR
ncbi:MAG TPA: hypothetical protein VGE07_18085 [Herpetosiphonaceae bacterium]